jgi:hypothetical protein
MTDVSKFFSDQLKIQNDRIAEKRAKAAAELATVTAGNDEILKRGRTDGKDSSWKESTVGKQAVKVGPHAKPSKKAKREQREAWQARCKRRQQVWVRGETTALVERRWGQSDCAPHGQRVE